MAGKRKRTLASTANAARKRIKPDDSPKALSSPVATRLLTFYYPFVTTLRDFVIAKFPIKAKEVQRRFERYGPESELSRLLDTTLIGLCTIPTPDDAGQRIVHRERSQRSKDFFEFTQRLSGTSNRRISDGSTTASTLGEGGVAMSDLVDFAIWTLFHRRYPLVRRPSHVLCHGYQKTDFSKSTAEDHASECSVDGLRRAVINAQVERLKGDDWCHLLRELGFDGDHTMLELLLDCGVFLPIECQSAGGNGDGNYWQIAGVGLAELPLIDKTHVAQNPRLNNQAQPRFKKPNLPKHIVRSPSTISFVRSRMFYARATLNGKGRVRFGLRHIHVLNRFPDAQNEAHAKHIMKHLFPRQYKLHNVFTSTVDTRETAYAFKEYTLREHEIAIQSRKVGTQAANKIPRRLRGQCFALVQRMQQLHQACAYKELLLHYCPVGSLDDGDKRSEHKQNKRKKRISDAVHPGSTANLARANALLSRSGDRDGQTHLTQLASPTSSVSAFVRSIILNVVPKDFLGTGSKGADNFRNLLNSVRSFIVCSRFENLTLNAVSQNMNIECIEWLRPVNVEADSRMSLSDHVKRRDLLHEFLYYLFDSFLIPLVRSNFHVTESNDQKYRLFYFRHDVWRLVTQPSLSRLKSNMYQEIPTVKAQDLLNKRSLGYSQVRLLPKKASVRPITNLRRREMIRKRGKQYLGPSINSTMRNVFSMLNYEKSHQPTYLQSSIFSVNELYPRLLAFQSQLRRKGLAGKPLYFVKVDVQSCFDTIPQQAVLYLVENICHGKQYTIKHHAEVRAPISAAPQTTTGRTSDKPTKKFLAPAHASRSSQHATFSDLVEQAYSTGKRDTVFVEGAVQSRIDTEAMLDLLDDHVSRNIVRIGKKFHRQKDGIPQGSVLSTLLCSFFYGDFEAKKLAFLHQPPSAGRVYETTLIRLIDDFLLITTERTHADQFLSTMLTGDAEYGITVRSEKTLANFKPSSDKFTTPACIGKPFPWCNLFINTRSLAITRDRNKGFSYLPKLVKSENSLLKIRGQAPDPADSTTVEVHRRAGVAFHRKTLAAIRMNVRPMYTDMASASAIKVKRELYMGLLEVAERASRYLVKLEELNNGQGLRSTIVQRTIKDTACATNSLLKKSRTTKFFKRIGKVEIDFLVVKAFETVLNRQQARHSETLTWLCEWHDRIRDNNHALNHLLKVPRLGE